TGLPASINAVMLSNEPPHLRGMVILVDIGTSPLRMSYFCDKVVVIRDRSGSYTCFRLDGREVTKRFVVKNTTKQQNDRVPLKSGRNHGRCREVILAYYKKRSRIPVFAAK
ncbi:MAG: hypothetical protein WD572_09425, partial [Gammaproteobacteria bacterium]